jgi:hypothetical protein
MRHCRNDSSRTHRALAPCQSSPGVHNHLPPSLRVRGVAFAGLSLSLQAPTFVCGADEGFHFQSPRLECTR